MDNYQRLTSRQGKFGLLAFLLLFAALLLRVWQIELKPPHFDEGINGFFVAKMWKEGFYRYDPTNFHGPLYFYFLQLAELVFGHGIRGFRIVTGLISLGIVALALMHRRFFGAAAIWAALAITVSTGFVFYGRYAIHESMFIFLQLLFSYGFFLWREERSRRAVVYMTMGFFGMFAVKETFFIFYGTWLIAWACVIVTERFWPSKPELVSNKPATGASTSDIVAIVVLGAVATAIVYTGFFLNLKGAADMFSALMVWTKTGVGATGHEKPFVYYLKLLWQYEWPALLALVVSPIVYFLTGARERLLVIFSFGAWLSYSIVPYKTPWLVLNFLWPLFFTLGLALERARMGMPSLIRPFVRVFGVLALLALSFTMYRMSFSDFNKLDEPYVYVQTTMEFKTVVDIVEERVRLFPEDKNMKLLVLNRDPWPMPWVFGRYPGLQYGQAEDANVEGSDVVLVDDSTADMVESRLGERYYRLPFQIRDSYQQGRAYLRVETFKGVVPESTGLVGREGEAQK